MGWFLRKSLRLGPGIRLNVSKSGPRLSVGVPGARASVGLDGRVRLFGGKGPLRFQKQFFGGVRQKASEPPAVALLKRLFKRR